MDQNFIFIVASVLYLNQRESDNVTAEPDSAYLGCGQIGPLQILTL